MSTKVNQTKKIQTPKERLAKKKEKKNKQQQQKNRMKRQKNIPEPQNYIKRIPKPAFIVESPTQESLYQSIVKITPDWNPAVMQEMLAVMGAFFLQRNVGVAPDQSVVLSQFYDGLLYQFQGMVDEIAGRPALVNRLNIVNDIIRAFYPKEVITHKFFKNSYSWTGIARPGSAEYPTAYNVWRPLLNLDDDGTYLSPTTIYSPVPTDTAYAEYLNLVKAISSARASCLTSVDGEHQSPLSNDVSAFAKVYTYLGLNPSNSGGYYNDVESEVAITAPVLSHNVLYNTSVQDNRVPRKLNVNEGGPGTALAPLVAGYNSWFNKCAINFKFLDMFEVVNTLIYWYIGGAVEASEANGIPISQYAFNFTLQDFVIVVRQALMATFKDQFLGQFLGPLQYDSNATNFLPLQILSNCFGADMFNRLLVPKVISENMAMLQTQKLKQSNRKSEINKVFFVPVWGYYNDIQPEWQLVTPATTVPLFAPATQKTINYVDCSYGSNTYVNVNSAYYTSVFETWNDKIKKLKAFVNVSDLANLTPPNTCFFLQMTRVNGFTEEKNGQLLGVKGLNFPSLKPIANLVAGTPVMIKDTDSKRSSVPKVSLPRPTNVQFISETDRLSMFPVMKEIHEFCNYLVLPSIRLDPSSSNDILNKSMYQTITGEGLSMPQSTNSIAPGYLNRQLDTANMCIEGQGKIYSSSISSILDTITKEGNGGILSGLLGGVLSSVFPSASGVIGSIASAIPI